tara:strand:- start:572 stop:1420 length:849 start_codon:yes stop_codon:yes gene_type:complete
MINIVVTSKPVDGLFYYSYEYCSYLNSKGIKARVIVITHRKFTQQDYLDVLKYKYIHQHNVLFNSLDGWVGDATLIMGRSMMTLSYQDFDNYSIQQQMILRTLFSGNVISVYSENHPAQYPLAVKFYNPEKIVDLCDKEVYPEGVGIHFEKTINFEIHKPYKDNIQFKHLFLGTNEKYYQTVQNVIDQYPDHGILTYDAEYINPENNNIFVPVKNLMSLFETYVYTKDTFDPAPRIFQECKYYNKDVIYLRDKNMKDGGTVYWNRDVGVPDIKPIETALGEF